MYTYHILYIFLICTHLYIHVPVLFRVFSQCIFLLSMKCWSNQNVSILFFFSLFHLQIFCSICLIITKGMDAALLIQVQLPLSDIPQLVMRIQINLSNWWLKIVCLTCILSAILRKLCTENAHACDNRFNQCVSARYALSRIFVISLGHRFGPRNVGVEQNTWLAGNLHVFESCAQYSQ